MRKLGILGKAAFQCSYYFVPRGFGESGLFENEPTAPAEQAHTTRGGSEKPTQRKVPAGKGLGMGWGRAVTVATDRSMSYVSCPCRSLPCETETLHVRCADVRSSDSLRLGP